MEYIITNGKYFCHIGTDNTIIAVENISRATKYTNIHEAKSRVNTATKKLKGYWVVEYKNGTVGERCDNSSSNTKRKQFSQDERMTVYNKDKGRCAICGRFISYEEFTIDHIIPLAKGGTNEMKNLQCACNKCNLIKSDILPDELMDKLHEIVLYQSRKNPDEKFNRKIIAINKMYKKNKIRKTIKDIFK